MAKYVNVEILETVASQMIVAAHEAHAEYIKSGDEFLLGQMGGCEGAAELLEDAFKEHAIDGRLTWHDR